MLSRLRKVNRFTLPPRHEASAPTLAENAKAAVHRMSAARLHFARFILRGEGSSIRWLTGRTRQRLYLGFQAL